MSVRDPLNRRLAIVAAATPLAAISYAIPTACRAVAAAVHAGWEVVVGPHAGLNTLLAEEAVRDGGSPTVVLPCRPPRDHWVRLLRAVYGEAVRWRWCDREMDARWVGAARVHHPDLCDPDSLAVLATAHAAVEGAALALVLPPVSALDVVVDHAAWLCKLLEVPMINIGTIGDLADLRKTLPTEPA